MRSGYRTVVAFGARGEGERAAYNLGRLKVRWVNGAAPQGADLAFAEARLRDGFVAPGFRLAVIPEHRLFRRRAARTGGTGAGAGRRRGALRSFTDLRTGDIVVHEDHGLARFAGFDTKTVAGVTRDYLNLEYAGTDKVFLPVDQFAKISRYVGAGGEHPPLSKLGGTRWETIKSRARKAAQELAGELLNLYAERRRREGHAFPPDSDWQRDFEDAWPYRETPDQREAIEQVKIDMEAPRPMDRLVCGDVGYGKTEVALRAAFKAANDGKQVMVLVPTTILAQQHYGTFSERLKDYPFTIEHVSRFRPAADQRAAIRAFGDGRVDILIGTHRLLSRDVRARDLGLLIVDEEQRFGVKQKELLRQVKLRVDVLAMSATPIPRTLQMSIAGIRDLSVIETPPEGRRPVKTYVGEYDEQLVKAAIERERARRGQAFFLHNRVETIDETAERLRGLVPEARFVVAHGQLDEHELETRMLAFLRGDADVLVATSIIESGIDIPQANTLIIERADHFGLAQLYQIRGRVGRRASARTRTCSIRRRRHSRPTRRSGSRRCRTTPSWAPASRSRCVTSSCAAPATCSATSSPATSRRSASSCTCRCSTRRSRSSVGRRAASRTSASRCGSTSTSTHTSPPTTSPTSRRRSTCTAASRGPSRWRSCTSCATSWRTASDRCPSRWRTCCCCSRRASSSARRGRAAVSFRGGRLAVTPIDLDSRRAKRIREEIPEALYESGKSQLSMRVPDDPAARFPAVVRAADVLLAVTREAA